GKKIQHLVYDLDSADASDSTISKLEIIHAIAEGAILSAYRYDKYLSDKKEGKSNVTHVSIIDSNGELAKEAKKILNEAKIVCESVYLARNLENAPGNEIYPETLAET